MSKKYFQMSNQDKRFFVIVTSTASYKKIRKLGIRRKVIAKTICIEYEIPIRDTIEATFNDNIKGIASEDDEEATAEISEAAAAPQQHQATTPAQKKT